MQQPGGEPGSLAPGQQVVEQLLTAAETDHLLAGPQQPRRRTARRRFQISDSLRLNRVQNQVGEPVAGQHSPECRIPVEHIRWHRVQVRALPAGRVGGHHPGQQVTAEQRRPGQPGPR